MLKVGLTGGIGSGKSLVAGIWQVLGIPVFNADQAAKKLMQEDETLKQNIILHFGQEAYSDGQLNRSWLAAQVFGNSDKTALLNRLVHPAVIRAGTEWMNRQHTPYAIKEAALFFESGSDREMDVMLGVYAPEDLRITRVMQRDGMKREQVLERISRQMKEEEKMHRCRFVVLNDGSKMIIPQVLDLHEQLLRLAKAQSTVL